MDPIRKEILRIQTDRIPDNIESFVVGLGAITIWASDLPSGSVSIRPMRASVSASAASSRSRKRAGIKRVYMAAGFYFLNSNFRGFEGGNEGLIFSCTKVIIFHYIESNFHPQEGNTCQIAFLKHLREPL